MSTSGQFIVVFFGGSNGGLFLSSNYGVNWSQYSGIPTSISDSDYSVDISTSGQYINLVVNNLMYNSTNYGQTWSQNVTPVIAGITSPYIINSSSVSSTGQYQIITTTNNISGGEIYFSTDYGNSWNQNSSLSSTNWIGVATSSIGQWSYLVSGTQLYVCYQGSNNQLGTNRGDYLYYSGNIYNNWVVADQQIILGANAGFTGQGTNAVAIGAYSAYSDQGQGAVSVGYSAGYTGQGQYAVAVGSSTANLGQGQYSVAIGYNAASENQGQYAVSIGNNSCEFYQGNYSIAIGNNAGITGNTGPAPNSIILNASSSNLSSSNPNGGFYVNPLNFYSPVPGNSDCLYYNPTTHEVFAGPSTTNLPSDYRIKENVTELD
jgi:hypothetical protein